MVKNKKWAVLYSIELNIFFLSISLIAYLYVQNVGFVPDIEKFIYLIWHITCCLIAIKRYGFFSVYALFLMFLMFFIYDSIFFDLINYSQYENFDYIYFPIKKTFSAQTVNSFLFYSSMFLFVLDITYTVFILKKHSLKKIRKINEGTCSKIIYITSILMLALLPICLYRFLIVLQYTRNHGYIYVILNGVPDSVLPGWTNGISGIVYSLFLVLFIHLPSRRKMYPMMVLWGIVVLLKGSSGNRGQFLYSFFALVVSYLSFYKSKNVKFIYVFFIVLFVFIFAIYIGRTRYNKNNTFDFQSNILFNFLANQTGTRAVPMVVIEGDIAYRQYPFIFSGENIKNKDNLSRIENIKRRNSINQLTCYKLSPKVTLRGRGLGGSVLAEFIDCGGMFGVIFWTLFLAILIAEADNIKFVPDFLRPLVYLITVNLFHAPRGYFFHFLSSIKYYIFAVFLYLIIKLFCQYAVHTKKKGAVL